MFTCDRAIISLLSCSQSQSSFCHLQMSSLVKHQMSMFSFVMSDNYSLTDLSLHPLSRQPRPSLRFTTTTPLLKLPLVMNHVPSLCRLPNISVGWTITITITITSLVSSVSDSLAWRPLPLVFFVQLSGLTKANPKAALSNASSKELFLFIRQTLGVGVRVGEFGVDTKWSNCSRSLIPLQVSHVTKRPPQITCRN